MANIIHVSKSGNDKNSGTVNAPLLTISRAEALAQPGDRVIVHTGTYRETVVFNQGGTSANKRISYTAALGEVVKIKGSERVNGWRKSAQGVWRLELDNKFFIDFNPFRQLIAKDSSYRHLGEVYLNDKPLTEQRDSVIITGQPFSWFTAQCGAKTVILANFGSNNPNTGLAEISVRPEAFTAGKKGLSFITLDGFNISQVASLPAFVDGEQPGAIYTNGGTHWVIRNCKLHDIKSVAISIGETGHPYIGAGPGKPEYSDLSQPIANVGHHVIQHNYISRCGQAGVFGLLHGTQSVIKDNLIEHINADGNYPIYGTAGIRLVLAVDALIEHNLIRSVSRKAGSYGIFLGPLFQGTRVSRNVIISSEKSCIYFFNSHGPALIDNNILSGASELNEGVKMYGAEANVFAQNLFHNCKLSNSKIPGRPYATSNFLAHTLVIKQTIPALTVDNRWWSNLFISGGFDGAADGNKCESNFNVFTSGAAKAGWGDAQSIKIDIKPVFKLINSDKGVSLVFDNRAIPAIQSPFLTAEYIGFFTLSKQYLETPNGEKVNIDKDFNANRSPNIKRQAGPFYRTSSAEKSHVLFSY